MLCVVEPRTGGTVAGAQMQSQQLRHLDRPPTPQPVPQVEQPAATSETVVVCETGVAAIGEAVEPIVTDLVGCVGMGIGADPAAPATTLDSRPMTTRIVLTSGLAGEAVPVPTSGSSSTTWTIGCCTARESVRTTRVVVGSDFEGTGTSAGALAAGGRCTSTGVVCCVVTTLEVGGGALAAFAAVRNGLSSG